MWIVQFMAVVGIICFEAAVQARADPELPGTQADLLDPANDAHKPGIKAAKQIRFVMSLLSTLLPMKLLNYINDAKTGFPQGLAWKIMAKLRKTYRPTDHTSVVEAQRGLSKVSIQYSEHPEVILQQIGQIQADCPAISVDDESKMAIMIDVAPPKYEAILATQQIC